jgi:hypothetical protein
MWSAKWLLLPVALLPAGALRTEEESPVAAPKVRAPVARMAATGVAREAERALAARAAADWAVEAGRPQATVAVSGARSVSSALADFWLAARTFAEEGGAQGRQRVVAFPHWDSSAPFFQRVLDHLHECSSVCAYLGDSLMLGGRHPSRAAEDEPAAPYPLLLLRSFAQQEPMSTPEENGIDEAGPAQRMASDAEVLTTSRDWVEGIICKVKVCPFSSTADRAGLPSGGVTYPITHATTGEEVYEAFWNQIGELARTDERQLATVLLLTPRFAPSAPPGFDDMNAAAARYDGLAETLNSALTSLGLEEEVQLVFFHPEYTFRDGMARLGDDGAANFARRSPYPMINLLRTQQVRKAQRGLPTGSVYTTNERNLEVLGVGKLQRMLDEKDWSGVHEHSYAAHEENTWK